MLIIYFTKKVFPRSIKLPSINKDRLVGITQIVVFLLLLMLSYIDKSQFKNMSPLRQLKQYYLLNVNCNSRLLSLC